MVTVLLRGWISRWRNQSPMFCERCRGRDLEHALGDAMAKMDRFVVRMLTDSTAPMEGIVVHFQLGGSQRPEEVARLWERTARQLWDIVAVDPETEETDPNRDLPLFPAIEPVPTMSGEVSQAVPSSTAPKGVKRGK